MKKIFVVLVALATFVTYAYAEGDKNQKRLDGEIGQGDVQQERITNPNSGVLPFSQLDEDQKDTIYAIYEEEKLARDIYITLGDIYTDENTFANIQLSEQNHMDAVRNLCDKYGIAIMVSDEIGDFTIYAEEFNTFFANQPESLLEALKLGQAIEKKDIDDLGIALVDMPKDVVNVFNNLISGSLNHLDAFENAIERETSQ